MNAPGPVREIWRWDTYYILEYFIERVGIQQVAREARTTAATIRRHITGGVLVGMESRHKIEGWASRQRFAAYNSPEAQAQRLRAAVAAAVEKHGIMRVVDATDGARVTLRKYLAGEPVRPHVLRKLERWADPSPPVDERLNWPADGGGAPPSE